jgi:hypothetical protein
MTSDAISLSFHRQDEQGLCLPCRIPRRVLPSTCIPNDILVQRVQPFDSESRANFAYEGLCHHLINTYENTASLHRFSNPKLPSGSTSWPAILTFRLREGKDTKASDHHTLTTRSLPLSSSCRFTCHWKGYTSAHSRDRRADLKRHLERQHVQLIRAFCPVQGYEGQFMREDNITSALEEAVEVAKDCEGDLVDCIFGRRFWCVYRIVFHLLILTIVSCPAFLFYFYILWHTLWVPLSVVRNRTGCIEHFIF